MERGRRARSKRTSPARAGSVTALVCMRCARRYRTGLDGPCPRCGPEGVLDVEYDMARARRALVPRGLKARPFDIWRYLELLPVPAHARRPPLRVGWTPIVDAPRLAGWAGLRAL